jgi:TPR repeat protein
VAHVHCRLSKELERARKSSGSGSAGLSDGSRPEHISYGNIPGFSEEMRHLGDCYMHGSEGHSKDTDRAYKYYEAAAVHGCSGSSLFVGKRYLDGPEPDDGKALFFLTVAAKV